MAKKNRHHHKKDFSELIASQFEIKDENSDEMAIQMPISKVEVSKKIALPQEIACILVKGLLKTIKSRFLPDCQKGESILIYSKPLPLKVKRMFRKDVNMYGEYYNALQMGNITKSLVPLNSYVGLIRIGNTESDGMTSIDRAEEFDEPIEIDFNEFPNNLESQKSHRVTNKKITLKDGLVTVPVCNDLWNIISPQKEIVFYWNPEYENLLLYSEYFDVVFCNRNKKKYFVHQNNRNAKGAIKRDLVNSRADMIDYWAVIFDLSKMSYALAGTEKEGETNEDRNLLAQKLANFPGIKIHSKYDVELIVNFFQNNKKLLDGITNKWIKYNMSENSVLIGYYKKLMSKKISGFSSIEGKKNKKINIKPSKYNYIDDLCHKIFDYKYEYEKRHFVFDIVTVNGYKVVSVPQPIAHLITSGLVNKISLRNSQDIKDGEWLYIFATQADGNSIRLLESDENFYPIYKNAVSLGNLAEQQLQTDCYVGKFKSFDDETLSESKMFDTPIRCNLIDIPSSAKKWKSHAAVIKRIEMKNRIIHVPVDDKEWDKIKQKKGTLQIYWEKYFSSIFDRGTSYFAGDTMGFYGVCFLHNGEKKYFRQKYRNTIYEVTLNCGANKTTSPGISFDLSLLEATSVPLFNLTNKVDWILDWNCVRFRNRYIVVSPPLDGKVKFTPVYVNVPGALESYNYLKDYLSSRLSPIKCSVEGMKLTILDQIHLNEAILKFSKAAIQRGISVSVQSTNTKITPVQMSFNNALSKAKQMTPEEFKKYKSKYIDFLVDLQSPNHKIIPCVERLAHTNSDTTEYAFMFSVECPMNIILVVYENINPDRSTLLFLVQKESYNTSIRSIYDFLQSAETNKRSNLREKNIEIKQSGIRHYRSINHDDFWTWKRNIMIYKR